MDVCKLTRSGRIEKHSDARRDMTNTADANAYDVAVSVGVDWLAFGVGPYYVRLTEAELRDMLARVETVAARVAEAKRQLAV